MHAHVGIFGALTYDGCAHRIQSLPEAREIARATAISMAAEDARQKLFKLAAAELQRHVPNQSQAVLLYVEHGTALGGQAAIDFAFGHLRPPADARGAAGAQGRVDRLVGVLCFVAVIMGKIVSEFSYLSTLRLTLLRYQLQNWRSPFGTWRRVVERWYQ